MDKSRHNIVRSTYFRKCVVQENIFKFTNLVKRSWREATDSFYNSVIISLVPDRCRRRHN